MHMIKKRQLVKEGAERHTVAALFL